MKTTLTRNGIGFFAVLFFAIIFTSCNEFNYESVRGNGDVQIKTEFLKADYREVSLAGSFDILIVPSQRDSIVIAAESNILPHILFERNGDRLIIKSTPNTNLKTTKPVKITLYAVNIAEIDLSGSGNITADSLNYSDMTLSISGSGSILAGVIVENLEASIAGSGDIMVNGNSENTLFRIAGSGNVKSYGLYQQNCKANISGSGNIYTAPGNSLDANIAGSGSVFYKGNPSISVQVSGSGKVVPTK